VGSFAEQKIPPLGWSRWWDYSLRSRTRPTQKDLATWVGWVLCGAKIPPLGWFQWWDYSLRLRSRPTQKDLATWVGWVLCGAKIPPSDEERN